MQKAEVVYVLRLDFGKGEAQKSQSRMLRIHKTL